VVSVDCIQQETVADLPAEDLIGALRGTRGLRPRVDRGLASGLRAWLDDDLAELQQGRRGDVVHVSSRVFAPGTTSGGPASLLRGALVTQLVALNVAGHHVTSPAAEALDALGGGGRQERIAGLLEGLDGNERARLAAEVAAHDEVLRRALPELPGRWAPRCGLRLAIPLNGGSVQCHGTVDLAVGMPGGSHASVCLVDVTTSPLASYHETVCRYLALLETLRSGEPPLRVAVLSTADGAAKVRDVNPELLARAVGDLLDVVRGVASS
jgi:hypothetical protein